MNTSAGGDSLSSHLFLGSKFHWDVWKILSTMEINHVKLIEISPFMAGNWTLLVFPGWAEGNQSPGLQDLHLRSGLQSERSSVEGATIPGFKWGG